MASEKVEYCSNCDSVLSGKYCSHCGQKKFDRSQKTFRHLLHDVFHFLTHLEGNIFTTFKTTVLAPGTYSKEYFSGKQKKYFKPISFFLIIVIAYLAFPFMEGLNMNLSGHKHMIIYGKMATQQIDKKLIQDGISYEGYSEIYANQSAKIAKPLLLSFIPLTAILLWAFFYKNKNLFYEHLIVSTEVNAIYIFMLYFMIPILATILMRLGTPIHLFEDQFIFPLSLILFSIYLLVVFKKCYPSSNYLIIKSLAISVLHFLVVQTIYRFILFEFTYFTT